MVHQPETRYAKGPEGNIAYQVVGDGPTDLVIVPGWFSHVDLLWGDPGWMSFVGELASFARVILYDKLGTGLSDPVDGVPTLESRADDLRAVVDAAETFGLSRPVYYVTQELFNREGLPGLLPRKRGPKRPHKLTEEVLAVLAQAVREAERMPSGAELAVHLAERCGIRAHPRTILRRLLPYLKQAEKKRR